MSPELQAQLRGQNGTCPTMKVKADNEQGFMVINEHDFDKTKHEKFVEPKAKSEEPKK